MTPSIARHVLQSNGLTFEFFLNEESGAMRYHFPEAQRIRSLRKEVRAAMSRQVIDWRNAIVSEWSVRTGKSLVLVNAQGKLTMIDGSKITSHWIQR